MASLRPVLGYACLMASLRPVLGYACPSTTSTLVLGYACIHCRTLAVHTPYTVCTLPHTGRTHSVHCTLPYTVQTGLTMAYTVRTDSRLRTLLTLLHKSVGYQALAP